MITAKVVMVVLLMGTHATTGKSISSVKAINLYPTMKSCMSQRMMFRAGLKTTLNKADWITNDGKAKVNHANIVCVSIKKLLALETVTPS